MPDYCAIVIGGSIAGMLAARALSDHCAKVLVVDRDALPDAPEVRRRAPQGGQVHALLDSGREAIEALLPGIFDEIGEDGGFTVDFGHGVRWYHAGAYKVPCDTRFRTRLQSRPLLEHHVRRRVAELPTVEIRTETTCTELLTQDGHVSGVRLRDADGHFEDLSAAIVVDASGRGSKAVDWLVANGYPTPPVRSVPIGQGYAAVLFEKPTGVPEGVRLHITYGTRGKTRKHGLLAEREDGLWQATLMGYHGDHAPTDLDGFMGYVQALERPEMYRMLRDAKPVSDVRSFKIPHQVRRDYHRIDLPEGLVILGDAMCAFDPVFGQGMSVAAQQAMLLGDELARNTFSTARFERQAARIADRAWLVTRIEATRYPEARAARFPGVGLFHRFLDRVFAVSAHDPVVYRAFLEVLHLHQPATYLARPSVLWRLLPRFRPVSLPHYGRSTSPNPGPSIG